MPFEAEPEPTGRAAPDAPTPLPFGRREANKREKLARIRQAAKHVFLEKGFEAATVREIAVGADVAFGTLFLYAKNKQDLLLLIFEEEFLRIAERASAKADPAAPFLEQVVAFLAEFFDFFCATPALSRDMLKEVTFSTGGIVAARVRAGVQDVQPHLARLVARAQAEGQVSSGISPDLAAQVIFSLHRIELRFCLDAETPDVPASLDRLRSQLEVLLLGFRPREVASDRRAFSLSHVREGARTARKT